MSGDIIKLPSSRTRRATDRDQQGLASKVERRDEVGELMRDLYREVQAEPIPRRLLDYSLSKMPVGRYDDSVMHPEGEDDDDDK